MCLKFPYRDQHSLAKHYRTAMPPQQSSTDLHAVACSLSKLNAGAKIGAPHYRACFTLSMAADNLVLSTTVLFCYCTYYQISLLHACNTRIHVHEREGLWRVSEAVTRIPMRTYTCASYVRHKNDIKMCAYYELCA